MAWLRDENQEITRGSVKLLREFLDDKGKQDQHSCGPVKDRQDPADYKDNGDADPTDKDSMKKGEMIDEPKPRMEEQQKNGAEDKSGKDAGDVDKAFRNKDEKPGDSDRLKIAVVQVQHNDCLGRLILNRRPSVEGFGWLKYDNDGQELEADLSSVRLIALVEG